MSWVAANAQGTGVDGRRLAMAGDSAGGNMVAAVTLLPKSTWRAQTRFSGHVLSQHRCQFQLRLVLDNSHRLLFDP